MTDRMDVADWIAANVKLTEAGPSEGFHLYGYQRAVAEAMSDPAVKVRFLTPAEARRLRGPSDLEVICMMAMLKPGENVLVYERVDSGDAP